MYSCKCVRDILKKNLDERNVRIRIVSTHENNGSESQSHSISEPDEVDCELETPNNKCAIAVRKISIKQERNISGNMKAFFLYY